MCEQNFYWRHSKDDSFSKHTTRPGNEIQIMVGPNYHAQTEIELFIDYINDFSSFTFFLILLFFLS